MQPLPEPLLEISFCQVPVSERHSGQMLAAGHGSGKRMSRNKVAFSKMSKKELKATVAAQDEEYEQMQQEMSNMRRTIAMQQQYF